MTPSSILDLLTYLLVSMPSKYTSLGTPSVFITLFLVQRYCHWHQRAGRDVSRLVSVMIQVKLMSPITRKRSVITVQRAFGPASFTEFNLHHLTQIWNANLALSSRSYQFYWILINSTLRDNSAKLILNYHWKYYKMHNDIITLPFTYKFTFILEGANHQYSEYCSRAFIRNLILF